MGYVKAPPDTAFLISGLRKKTVIGKAAIRIPFLERIDRVSLKLISIDVKTSTAVPTADYINIRVDAVVNVKVSDEPEKLSLAAQNFLNQKPDYIASVAREVLEGNMREIVGRMRLEEMVGDRQKFATLVKENADPDLAGMGLDIISFNVQNFIDDNQVIENLGVDNIVQISKNAAVSRANAEKEIAVAQAKAAKESNDAQVAAELEIANVKAKAQKEKAIVQAQAEQESQAAKIVKAANELAAKKRAEEEAVKQAEADMQKILDTIQSAKLARNKAEDDAKIATEKELAAIEKTRQDAYAATVADIMKSISPDLIAALTSKSNADMLATVSESMSPYAIANGGICERYG